MVEQELAAYTKATGAYMDMEQFEEIFGQRLENPKLVIPRSVERWFEEPTTPSERRIRQMISLHRAAAKAALEHDIALQRARLAGALQKLATKPTKKAAEDERIATDKIEKGERRLAAMQDATPRKSEARIFPMHYAPIILEVGGKRLIRLARYHCRQAGKPASIDREKDGLYNARRDNITRFWRNEFAHTHALMLVREFFENVDRDGKNAVLHFTPNPPELMRIACVYSVWTGDDGKQLLSFAAVTDEPPEEVAAAGHDRMIINIQPQNIDAWLRPEGRSEQELQGILSDRRKPFYEHEVMAA